MYVFSAKSGSKRLYFGLFICLACLILIAATFYARRNVPIGSEPWIQMQWESTEAALNVPSITDLDGRRFLAANFDAIYEVDPERHMVRNIGIVDDRFQPAGIHYDHSTETLFSANYLHNNVSVHRKVGSAWQRVAIFDGLTSPEGVWFDPQHHVLAVAEFDGHRVTLLDVREGEHPTATKRWSREVRYAHGITMMDGRVYATGLHDRQIFEFDMEGNQLSVVGKLGWRPEELGMLWPTSILPDGLGRLIVSDAETGYVWIYDPRTKSFVTKIGGAGPGRSNFVQPYAASRVGDQLVVVSTKAQRFLFLSYPEMSARHSLVKDPTLWAGRETGPVFFGKGEWKGYSWVDGPVVPLLGKEFGIFNAMLVAKDGSDAAVRVGYNIPTIGPVSYVKQLVVHESAETKFLFSPYASQAVAYRETDGRLYTLWFNNPQDCWPLDGEISCASKSTLDVSQTVSQLTSLIREAGARQCAEGHLSYSDLVEAISVATRGKANEVDRLVSEVFKQAMAGENGFDGAKLLQTLKQQTKCQVDPVTQRQIKDVLSLEKGQVVTIDQLSLLSLLATDG